MHIKKLAAAIALGLASIATGAGATTIINVDNPAGAQWTGFDWAQAGTAFTTGFTPTAGDTFTLTYFAWAVALQNGINPFPNSQQVGLDTIANGAPGPGATTYEYTVVATLNETVDSCTANTCTFDVNGGTFDVYYDLAQNANAQPGSLGTGFQHGTHLIGGTVNPLANQTFSLVNGSNSTTLTGTVNFTNTTYINPALIGSTATTTLQIGPAQTNGYVSPGGFNGTAFAPGTIVFQADGNQSFTSAVPEPGSLALIGLGIATLGFVRRRKS